MTPPSASDLTFNLVWIGDVFKYLRPFTSSLLAHSTARVRFVANGCGPATLDALDAYAGAHPDRVVEVLPVSPDVLPHGVVLDRVLRDRDDGDHFCFVDTDIRADGPWLEPLLDQLTGAAAVTSGKPLWDTSPKVKIGQPFVAGSMIEAEDGTRFGSPHLAVYHRRELEATIDRWGAGFGAAAPEIAVPGATIPPAAVARLDELGHHYVLYDTGKVVNLLLQGEGHELVHRESPHLLHIGGVSDHLTAPPLHFAEASRVLREAIDRMLVAHGLEPRGDATPSARDVGNRPVLAEFAAALLGALVDDTEVPDLPEVADPEVRRRAVVLRDQIVDLVQRYGRD